MAINIILPIGMTIIAFVWMFTLGRFIPSWFDEEIMFGIAGILWVIFFLQSALEGLLSSASGIILIILALIIVGYIILRKVKK